MALRTPRPGPGPAILALGYPGVAPHPTQQQPDGADAESPAVYAFCLGILLPASCFPACCACSREVHAAGMTFYCVPATQERWLACVDDDISCWAPVDDSAARSCEHVTEAPAVDSSNVSLTMASGGIVTAEQMEAVVIP